MAHLDDLLRQTRRSLRTIGARAAAGDGARPEKDQGDQRVDGSTAVSDAPLGPDSTAARPMIWRTSRPRLRFFQVADLQLRPRHAAAPPIERRADPPKRPASRRNAASWPTGQASLFSGCSPRRRRVPQMFDQGPAPARGRISLAALRAMILSDDANRRLTPNQRLIAAASLDLAIPEPWRLRLQRSSGCRSATRRRPPRRLRCQRAGRPGPEPGTVGCAGQGAWHAGVKRSDRGGSRRSANTRPPAAIEIPIGNPDAHAPAYQCEVRRGRTIF